MKHSIKELVFSLFAFLFTFLIAYLTKIDAVQKAVIIAFVIQWISFIPAYLLQTEKFYDITGTITYLTVISYCLYSSFSHEIINYGNLIISLLILIWAIRLGSFLFIRIKKTGEDIRFREIKKSPTRFFMTWTLQGMWVSLCTACALAGISKGIVINSIFFIGISIFFIGFIIEVIADNQKSKFRSIPSNKDKFITTGIWKYSRHPNYLGEIILWFGISLISFSSLQGMELVTLISPVFTYFLLVNVSGIRILEYNGNRKWGNLESYKKYLKNTPRLLGPF